MDASARAVKIAKLLSKDRSLAAGASHAPIVGEIPLTAAADTFVLVVNFYVKPEMVSLPLLWSRTVPIIRRLHAARQLAEFQSISVQVIAYDDGGDGDRVLRVGAVVRAIDRLPPREAGDLLRDDWSSEEFGCCWYRDRSQIPGQGIDAGGS